MNGQLFDSLEFEPTVAAARARIAAIRPAAYARSRNHLEGAVTRLSPYLTHGFVTLRDVLAGVLLHGPLPIQHKLVYELGWREYFQHVWQHEGDAIFESLHEGVLPDAAYSRELPDDIRQGQTGVPVIDQAVRTLVGTGYLHNHARMWLASYVVHLRKVHWRSGADWLYGHLLDGDLASNHLSWQWVAGTGSHKPYLFNADNVARYAPSAWHSPGTAIDTDYGALDHLARSPRAVPGGRLGAREPAPPLLPAPPGAGFTAPDAAAVQGRPVRLIHAWNLGEPLARAPGECRIGVALREFHSRWPWSERRWQFVSERLRAVCDGMWLGTAAEVQAALGGATVVHRQADRHMEAWTPQADPVQAPTLLDWPPGRCASFSQFWNRAAKGLSEAGELLR